MSDAHAASEEERLAAQGVLRVRAPNPGPLTLSGTNSWLLGRDPAWLIDPGPLIDSHLESLLAAIAERGGLGGVALTHDHRDHAEAVQAVRERHPAPLAAGRGPAEVRLSEGARFGPLQALSVPGHAPDHFALLAGGVCFTGDAVLGEGSVFISPYSGAMSSYLDALERLRAREDVEILCPGHGPPVWDPRAKLDEYLSHRRERERRLIAALEEGRRSTRGAARLGLVGRPRAAAPASRGNAGRASRQARGGAAASRGRRASRLRRDRLVSTRRTKQRSTRPARASAPQAMAGSVGFSPGSPFPPIADYGFLSDCHTCALLAPDGSIEWMCLPHFDSPWVFGSLLDRGAGSWRVGPYGTYVPAGQRYIPGTNMIETTWMTSQGWMRVIDALTIGEWHDNKHATSHTRPPTDYDADHLLVRCVECIQGEVQLEIVCEPMLEYGATPATWTEVDLDDGESCATDACGPDERPVFRLFSDVRLGVEGNRAHGRHTMQEGEKRFCALSWTEALGGPHTVAEAEGHMERTSHFWRSWLAEGTYPDHPWRYQLQRSALTLKGLTFMPTGALVAAATTSLPETPGGERNWDYRFCWMRDATFTLWALHALGLDWEADDFIQYVADMARNDDGSLQIMYGIDGAKDLAESTLDHLTGYEGARPVRIGNGAYKQRQNDVYGAVLDSVYLHSKQRDHIPERLWPVLTDQVKCAVRDWKKPDQGIWESRGPARHYVSSKLMCWVALDRGARLAERRGRADDAEKWQALADEIKAEILERGVDERGVFRQHYETDALDASSLLVSIVRFLPADDERVRATVKAIRDELTEGGLVLRYRTEATDDGLHGEEGTFLICSFWLVTALSEIGEDRDAAHLCERLLSYASPLGLYAEELEASSGRHLGNYPQAFTHLALINAVTHVIEAQEALGRK